MATSGEGHEFQPTSTLSRRHEHFTNWSAVESALQEKDRPSCWSPFPMGQRPKNTLRKASSYLLKPPHSPLSGVRRGQRLLRPGRGRGRRLGQWIEESSDSEMLNFEVCLPSTPHPSVPSPAVRTPSPACGWAPFLGLQECVFLTARDSPPSHPISVSPFPHP